MYLRRKNEKVNHGLNSTPFVRQCDIMSNKWGDFYAQGSAEQTIHAGIQETGRGNHAEGKFELQRNSETIWNKQWPPGQRLGAYLSEGPEGFSIERRGRGSNGPSAKAAAERGRRRSAGRSPAAACGECLPKKLRALVLENERHRLKKHRWSKCWGKNFYWRSC